MMNVRRYARAFTALAAALALSACASTPPAPRQRIVLQPCDIQLRDAPKVARKSLTGATLVFPFRVTNPNTVPVLLERLKLEASVNGSALGSNVAVPGASIRGGASSDVPVNYDVSYISAGMGLIDAIAAQSAKITVVGDAKISCADGRFDADPLEHPFQIK